MCSHGVTIGKRAAESAYLICESSSFAEDDSQQVCLITFWGSCLVPVHNLLTWSEPDQTYIVWQHYWTTLPRRVWDPHIANDSARQSILHPFYRPESTVILVRLLSISQTEYYVLSDYTCWQCRRWVCSSIKLYDLRIQVNVPTRHLAFQTVLQRPVRVRT
jgi:hypothetical protein